MSDFKLDPTKKVNNNGATVVNGGNIDPRNPISQSLPVNTLGVNKGSFGSKLVEITAVDDGESQPYGLMPASNGGNFAYNPAVFGERGVIARGVGSAAGNLINGKPSTFLNRTASEYQGVPRFKKNTKQGSKISDGDKWLMPPPPFADGQIHPGFVPNPLRGSGYMFEDGKGGVADDKAVSANRSVPGEITFRFGAAKPKTSNLKPRDQTEGEGP
jgi:hypothetical protein